ncbi:MAG: NERD domain-containing protein [Methylomarinum sp.]|nr:NERD domain-containing protein [Methylomarinum sp.]
MDCKITFNPKGSYTKLFTGSLAFLVKTARFKGNLGEFFVNFNIARQLDKEAYHLIKNVTLPAGDGTTQVDHVIASKYGIFVLETKNMKGWIFGSAHQKMWTQKIYKYTGKFQNPLHQNYKHTQVLASLLRLNEEQVFSVIVFTGECTLKTEMPENVTMGQGFIHYIQSKKQVLFTDDEVQKLTRRIEAIRLPPSRQTNRDHVNHVKTIVAKNNKNNY